MTLLRRIPKTPDIKSSRNNFIKIEKLRELPVRRISAIDEFSVKIQMTAISMTMVTPRAIWVNGPFALSSLTTAIAEEGERAIRIEPASKEIASLLFAGRSFIK